MLSFVVAFEHLLTNVTPLALTLLLCLNWCPQSPSSSTDADSIMIIATSFAFPQGLGCTGGEGRGKDVMEDHRKNGD